MLMMRPQRAFVMPRTKARVMRNTESRLVDSTDAHSSSFMRSIRLSRVMPALLTRISTLPCCSCTRSAKASTEAGEDTSRTSPWPFTPASASQPLMAAAPDSEVAVPITAAPRLPSSSAMAWPIPRLAPVTTAILPAMLMFLCSCCSDCVVRLTCWWRSGARQRFLQAVRVIDRGDLQFGIDTLVEAGEDLAGAEFNQARDAACAEAAYRLYPGYRIVDLGHEVAADGINVRAAFQRVVLQYWHHWYL